jgi:hypothetical protein
MGQSGNGRPPLGRTETDSDRRPRRLVLLNGTEDCEVRQVLAEYPAGAIKGSQVHAEVRRLAAEHPGVFVAAEWLGPIGWTRFVWCRA